jgi:ERF superfamily
MHRSSENIGTIAAALAKAQLELTNPAKSLVGTLPGMTPNGDRSFRYAPLSSGLDLVRKSLGRYEIATVQTTAIDEGAGLVRLMTVLAHSSGEWISSEWPVCAVAETASPQRMGAALTYARRHSLFALVGIAGEDDLDAPDQPLAAQQAAASADPSRINGHAVLAPKPTTAMGRKPLSRPAKPILSADESAVVRDRLQTEVAALRTAEDLVAWATLVLPTKNSLQAVDAQALEEAFEAKRRALEAQDPPAGIAPIASEQPEGTSSDQTSAIAEPRAVGFPKTRRRRDKAHLQYVASKPCLVCGRAPCDAHHLRFAEPRALGRKVSDEFTVPLCRTHHRQVHNRGDERAWWEEVRINPQPIARQLWSDTRG